MVNSTKFNFIRKILRKNKEIQSSEESLDNSSPKSSKPMKRSKILSPRKLPTPPPSPDRFLSSKKGNQQHSSNCSVKQLPLTQYPRVLPLVKDTSDVIDLEKVISDFEMAYKSPRQSHDQRVNTNRFVKKMVEIFEKKTEPTESTYQDAKTFIKELDRRNNSPTDSFYEDEQEYFIPMNTYNNPKTFIEDFDGRNSSSDLSHEKEQEYYLPMGDKYVIEKQSKSLNNSLVNYNKSINIYNCSEAIHEEISDESITSFDETTDTTDSEWDCPPPRSDASLKRERAPKIIGAFLKKPIIVDGTQIDWVPLPPIKLPRKESFTKFFTLLGGKSLHEKYKLRKVRKESLDSGYDDKSISPTPSLKSIHSFKNTLLNDNYTYEKNNTGRPHLTFETFKPPQKNIDSVKNVYLDNKNTKNKTKIIFEDVPRSEVQLPLGPTFPSPKAQPKLFVKSLNTKKIIKQSNEKIYYRNSNKINKCQNNIPIRSRSPEYSFTFNHEGKYQSSVGQFVDEEFNQSKLRNRTEWTFPSSDVIYDVPRCISKSEPALFIKDKYEHHTYVNWVNKSYGNEPIYDVPRITILPRPKSDGGYDEILSLKRRNAELTSTSKGLYADSYASCKPNQAKFATIKPRISGLRRNREMLCIEHFKQMQRFTVPSTPDYSNNYDSINKF